MFNSAGGGKNAGENGLPWPSIELGNSKAPVNLPWINEFSKSEMPNKPESIWDLSSEQAYQLGLANGKSQLSAELKALAKIEAASSLAVMRAQQEQHFQTAYASFLAQLQGIEEEIAQGLVQLAVRLARATVRLHIETDVTAVLPIVREALAQRLPNASTTQLLVSPESEAIVRSALQTELEDGRLILVIDDGLSRSDVRMIGSASELDHTLETRWCQALIQSGITQGTEEKP